MADNTSYPDFLCSLDESQLIAHINSLSQFSENDILANNEANEAKINAASYNEGTSDVVSGSFVVTSTPAGNKKLINTGISENFHKSSSEYGKHRHPFLCSASSLTSDPFDDNLDSQLLKLDTKKLFSGEIPKNALVSASSLGSDGTAVPGNQLALLLTSDTSDTSEKVTKKARFEESGIVLGSKSFEDRDLISGNKCDENIQDHLDEEASTDNDEENFDGIPEKHSKIISFESFSGSDMAPVNHGYDNDLLGSSDANPFKDPEKSSKNSDLQPPLSEASPLDDPDITFAEVGPQHEFGDYDTYFQNKYRKQQVADHDFIRWEKQRRVANGQSAEIPRIFADCKIFVNGNTTPTLATIHKLVILHGGTFLSHLLNKGAATHIICDRLTPRKRVQFKNYRVVKAQWIADCVEQEKLLNWKDYRLIDDVEPLQKRLGFSKLDTGGVREEEEIGNDLDEDDLVPDMEGDLEEEGLFNSQHVNSNQEDLDDPFREGEILDEADFEEKMDIDGDMFQNASDVENMDDESIENHPNRDIPEDNPFLEATTPTSQNQNLTSQPTNRSSFTKPSHNTDQNVSQLNVARPRQAFAQMDAKHPDFLKHFFANSRLHHLSTWKADLKSKFLRLVTRGAEKPPKVPGARPVILHIDFDCFFATASALKHPHLNIKTDAIAVSHGGKSSDIASCNYVARSFGVSNGMWLGRALEQCANLKVIDYDFETYEKCSHAFYSYLVLKKVFNSIFPVSIDEVLVDATTHCHGDNHVNKVAEICAEVRKDILSLTGCPVSIGVSSNVLLAKLAIKKAKPDGAFYLHENIQEFLDETEIRSLPGIGRSLASRLAAEIGHDDGPLLIKYVKTLSKERLVRVFGEKTGLKIHDNCFGKDTTSIHLDAASSEGLLGRKTVSVDVNYGIRFDLFSQAETFLISLAKELHSRLIDLGACGSAVTLRLAKRAPDAPVVTPKFMGLGKCVFVSRTSSLGVATNDWGIIGSEMKALFRSFNIPPEDLRGIAVSMSKLEDIENVKRQRQQKLEFTRKIMAVRELQPPPMSSQMFPFAERVTGGESVDWNVFNSLPEEIRRELKKELLRRGIPVSAKERSPSKRGSDSSKVYFQQMFPTQPHGKFKVKRVIESPTKKKKLNESPTKTGLKHSESKSVPYNDTVSYDEDVLNEIPSSIRNEFMEELEWQKKHKRLGFVSMKTKMEQKNELQQRVREQVIDEKWLQTQPRAVVYPEFSVGLSNYHELVAQLRKWVSSTAADEGPHPEDVEMFEKYLTEVFEKGGVSRVSNLLSVLVSELRLQENISRLCCGENETQMRSFVVGIEDWRRHVARIRVGFSGRCEVMGIEI